MNIRVNNISLINVFSYVTIWFDMD